MIETAATTVVIAVVYSLYTYSSKWVKNGEGFEPKKFAKTVVVGFVVAAGALATGQEVTQDNIEALAATFGAMHVADAAVGAVWDRFVSQDDD